VLCLSVSVYVSVCLSLQTCCSSSGSNSIESIVLFCVLLCISALMNDDDDDDDGLTILTIYAGKLEESLLILSFFYCLNDYTRIFIRYIEKERKRERENNELNICE
jgi:hypothetical protein